MKRIIPLFALILLSANFISAQPKEAVIVVIDSAVYDFGTIKEKNGTVSCTFKIKNEGEMPLNISKIFSSCNCATTEWNKSPIEAGMTGEIIVTFNPAERPGPFTRSISIYSNGKVGSLVLTIKGNVE